MKSSAVLFLLAAIPALTCCAHATSTHRATWVWDESVVLSPTERQRLLRFARQKEVDLIFIHVSPAFDSPPGFAALADLARASASQGVSLVFVAGAPAWGIAANRSEAIAYLLRVARLGTRLERVGLPSSRCLLLDVETYLLPSWRSAPDVAVDEYLAFVAAIRSAADSAKIRVWHTIPFWFAQLSVGGVTLDERVLTLADGLVVMAYRNRPQDIREAAGPILEHATRHGRPVLVALETTCVDPPKVTFCGRPAAELAQVIESLGKSLGGSPAFFGIAVHSYSSWGSVDRGDAPPTGRPIE